MKLTKILLSALSTSLILAGCSVNGVSDLKLSSGNKLIDTQGYHSNKRRPLYNKKYINKAKQNIISSDYDDDEEDEDSELINPERKNLGMYKGMIKGKKNKTQRTRLKEKKSPYLNTIMEDDEEDDLDIPRSRKSLSRYEQGRSKEDLEDEISEIKVLLQKTKDEITKAKCPYTQNAPKTKKARSQHSSSDLEDDYSDTEIDEELREVAKPMVRKKNKSASNTRPWIATKPLIQAKPGAMTSIVRD